MSHKIMYYSTNHKSDKVSFKEALIKGQAPDKGLYLPDFFPKISLDEIKSMKNMKYWEIAFFVAKKLIGEEIPENELKKVCKESYNFEVPLIKVEGKKYLMGLYGGPTASFKDFAALMMARLMGYFNEDKELIILTATSGDTGSAVANAFYPIKGMSSVVLFPYKEISEQQRKLITTLGKNVKAIAVIDGKFDDCQAMVKQAFSDPDLSNLKLTSANSINFGRLLPQTVYYFYAYSKLAENGEEIIFSVPSGNFGDLTGGLIAKKMGLPVKKFIAAVNENDEFPKFLETGAYEPISPSKNCLSNAMNVGHPSNLARVFDLYGGWLDEKGNVIKKPDIFAMKRDIFSVSISNSETRKTIKNFYDEYKIIIEPHGAVGWLALENYLSQEKNNPLCVCLETAHPAKFPEEIRKIIHIESEIPESLSGLENKKENFIEMKADYEALKKFLINNFG